VPSPALDLGLLLDVDGPIASPVSRTIAIARILDDLVALTAAGVPVAFITGRSDEFVRERVIAPLRATGLDDALAVPGARMFCVFEKGAAWAPVTTEGLGAVSVDETVRVPAEFAERVKELHARDFDAAMFWDATKRAMVSVEQRVDVSAEDFYPQQSRFNDAAFALAVDLGLGVRMGERAVPDVAGQHPWRIDSTVISTDIESSTLDKDRGAERALDYFGSLGALPTVWRSVGDSRSDYKMADYVHARGLEVAHIDVRPTEPLPTTPYRVITEGDLVNDHAGAAFLAYWSAKLPR
jgi:hypothetical protein